jgi:hypothetical protein
MSVSERKLVAMNDDAATTVAVTLNVAPAAEERVIDWLLGRDEAVGFTSGMVFGHGADHADLSIAEQVTGRQRRVEIRLELARTKLETFVAELIAAFGGTDLYYFVTPVLRSGHLKGKVAPEA